MTLGPAVADEPLEMGERLGDGESASCRAKIVTEKRKRHFVAGGRLGTEGRHSNRQPRVVVSDELPRSEVVHRNNLVLL